MGHAGAENCWPAWLQHAQQLLIVLWPDGVRDRNPTEAAPTGLSPELVLPSPIDVTALDSTMLEKIRGFPLLLFFLILL